MNACRANQPPSFVEEERRHSRLKSGGCLRPTLAQSEPPFQREDDGVGKEDLRAALEMCALRSVPRTALTLTLTATPQPLRPSVDDEETTRLTRLSPLAKAIHDNTIARGPLLKVQERPNFRGKVTRAGAFNSPIEQEGRH